MWLMMVCRQGELPLTNWRIGAFGRDLTFRMKPIGTAVVSLISRRAAEMVRTLPLRSRGFDNFRAAGRYELYFARSLAPVRGRRNLTKLQPCSVILVVPALPRRAPDEFTACWYCTRCPRSRGSSCRPSARYRRRSAGAWPRDVVKLLEGYLLDNAVRFYGTRTATVVCTECRVS